MRLLRRILVGSLAALAACARLSGDGGPRPVSVSPAGAYRGQPARVRIAGTGYEVRGVQHLGGPQEISTAFEVRIGGRTLADVAYTPDESGQDVLEGTVPADLSAGIHDVEVRDPYGVSGVLPRAFTESDGPPPAIAASVTAPANAEAGVPFPVSITLANSGAEGARLDSVAIGGTTVGSSGALLPGGGSMVLDSSPTWTQPGSYQIDVQVDATDSVTGLSLPPLAQHVSVRVLAPPALVATPAAAPAAVDVGQPFALDLEVANTGEIAALSVQPVLASNGASAASLPAPQDVPAGAVRTFRFAVQATSPGLVTPHASAAGSDEMTGATVQSADAAYAPILAQLPAALRIAATSVPAKASLGQVFTAAITVANDGDADALAVQDSGGAFPGMTIVALPSPTTVAGHSTATLAWSLRAAQLGGTSLTFAVQGADVNSGAAATASAQAAVAVQSPATLALQLAAPPKVSVGQTFAVVATATNGGEANVAQLALPAPSCGVALVLVQSPAIPAQLAGLSSATVAWQYRATTAATVSCTAAASGVDANSLAPVSAQATSAPVLVQTAAALTMASIQLPGRIARGQTFSTIVTVSNGGEATALAVQPSVAAVTTGGAAAAFTLPAAVDIPGGASHAFAVAAVEDGTATGTVAVDAFAAGTDANSGAAVTAPSVRSAVAIVEEPAALRADSFGIPATLTQGQTFAVTLIVTNTGQATASGVLPAAPAITTSGGAAAVALSSPAAQGIAGGSSASFSWTFRESGSAPGTIQMTVRASGTDADSGAAVSAQGATAPAQVQAPPALSISAFTLPAAISRGQTFTVGATVANLGGATARAVQPRLVQIVSSGGAAGSIVTSPAAADIPGGTTLGFTWKLTENGTASGALAFKVDAVGSDANSGAALSAVPVTSPAVAVQSPAALTVTSVVAQSSRGLSTIDRGQAFTVQVTVANLGEATAAGALASPPSIAVSGTAHATSISTPAPTAIAGGASAVFSYGYLEDGSGVGTLTFTAGATGSDANSGAALTAPPGSGAIVVQTPAALTATLSAPASVPLGNQLTLSLLVTNSGDASATGVAPSAPAATGTGSVSVVSGPSPATTTVPGHSTVTFSWTLGTLSSGPVQLGASVSGTDDNDGGTRSASASTSTTVVAPPESAQLSPDPFSADGTTFSYLFSYQGMVYLGPNKSGTAAVRMAPDGSNPQAINWQLEVDQATPARNGAYVVSPSNPNPPACHTIGSATCKQGTTACGPDNEFGRGLLTSGFVNGVEWYALSGPSPTGGSRYLYLTNGTFPLATGGYDDLAYVQIASGQTGAARVITAGAFAGNRLYLGLFDEGGSFNPPTAPVLNALVTMPALPGYVAGAGTDLINLQAANFPAVGANGTPANSGKIWLMIDSIASLGNALYVANNGGIARSVGSTPAPCTAPGCATWSNSTPSAAAWGAKTSVTVDKTVLGALEPAQRAVPAMVPFAGRFFAARNTTTGPQLWSCNPALGADAAQCEPGDWALVAPNSSGDPQLTQFNNTGNSAITLVAATAQHLYVGFNDSAGVEVFRTSVASASARSDFTGQGGCNAATAGCHGVGGAGLGTGATRLFDGHAFTYSQLEWVYLSAGDGTTAPRIFRLAP